MRDSNCLSATHLPARRGAFQSFLPQCDHQRLGINTQCTARSGTRPLKAGRAVCQGAQRAVRPRRRAEAMLNQDLETKPAEPASGMSGDPPAREVIFSSVPQTLSAPNFTLQF